MCLCVLCGVGVWGVCFLAFVRSQLAFRIIRLNVLANSGTLAQVPYVCIPFTFVYLGVCAVRTSV